MDDPKYSNRFLFLRRTVNSSAISSLIGTQAHSLIIIVIPSSQSFLIPLKAINLSLAPSNSKDFVNRKNDFLMKKIYMYNMCNVSLKFIESIQVKGLLILRVFQYTMQ